jgi:hypothetical protein
MARFSDAKVGDKVYCRIDGLGTITRIKSSVTYPIEVSFNNGRRYDYTLCGRADTPDVEPILFYVDGNNKYSETRPKQKVEKTGWINIYSDPLSLGCYYVGIYPSRDIAVKNSNSKRLLDTIQITWFEEE